MDDTSSVVARPKAGKRPDDLVNAHSKNESREGRGDVMPSAKQIVESITRASERWSNS